MGQVTSALYADFLLSATPSANSENASLPVTNALSVTTPFWVHQSGNAVSGGAEFVTYDFGSAQTVAAIIIDNINVGSLTLKGKNTNSSWGSPTWTSGSLTVSKDGKSQRRKLFYIPTGSGSPFNYRYLRMEPATTTTDGSAYLRLGCMLAVKTITAWPQNHGFPWAPTQQLAIEPGTRVGGGGDPSRLGNSFAQIVLPSSRYDNMAMEAIFDDLIAQRDKPCVLFRNFQSNTSEVYIAHIVGQVTGPSRKAPGLLEVGAITLREVV